MKLKFISDPKSDSKLKKIKDKLERAKPLEHKAKDAPDFRGMGPWSRTRVSPEN